MKLKEIESYFGNTEPIRHRMGAGSGLQREYRHLRMVGFAHLTLNRITSHDSEQMFVQ